jgi:hypothetical protein
MQWLISLGADSSFEAIRVDAGQPDGGLLLTNACSSPWSPRKPRDL